MFPYVEVTRILNLSNPQKKMVNMREELIKQKATGNPRRIRPSTVMINKKDIRPKSISAFSSLLWFQIPDKIVYESADALQ
jgi:hypothetical protein